MQRSLLIALVCAAAAAHKSSSSSDGPGHHHHKKHQDHGHARGGFKSSSSSSSAPGLSSSSGSDGSSSSDSAELGRVKHPRGGWKSSSSTSSGPGLSSSSSDGPSSSSSDSELGREESPLVSVADLEGVAWVAKGWIGKAARGGDPDPFKDERLVKFAGGKVYFPGIGGNGGGGGPYTVGADRTLPFEAGELYFQMRDDDLIVEFSYKSGWAEVIYEKTPWSEVMKGPSSGNLDLGAYAKTALWLSAASVAFVALVARLRADMLQKRAATNAEFVALPAKPSKDEVVVVASAADE